MPGIAAAVSSDESKTNLWHKRLRHMSELGMTELTKRELMPACLRRFIRSFVLQAYSFAVVTQLYSCTVYISFVFCPFTPNAASWR